MSQSQTVQNVGNALTDGTGISKITGSKFVKDFVADFLMTAAAAVTTAGILSVDQAVAAPLVVGSAVVGAFIRVGYRALLKWSTS